MASTARNATYATGGYPFSRYIQGVGFLSVQTRYIAKVRRYIAVLSPQPWVGEIQIAVSSDGEDWNTFFTRVLEILTTHDNYIVRSYVVENRTKLLYEAGVSDDAPLVASVPSPISVQEAVPAPIQARVDRLMDILAGLSAARVSGDVEAHNAICDSLKGPDGRYLL
jgi:hypothetical protein